MDSKDITHAFVANIRVLLVSIVPPRNDCGVRIVMYRHLVERCPFELHVASCATFAEDLQIDTLITPPYLLQRLRKTRIAPVIHKYITDYENTIWPFCGISSLCRVVESFRPHVVLTLAETSMSEMAERVANIYQIPLAGLFLDWFPAMPSHGGHRLFRRYLDYKFKRLYNKCNLAICTSDGMRDYLGEHPNAHVIFPIPGSATRKQISIGQRSRAFTLTYVGNATGAYGQMLQALYSFLKPYYSIRLVIVGPTYDWPSELLAQATRDGVCLGVMNPSDSQEIALRADALLVVMSFSSRDALFVSTSFTTKLLDYTQLGKPIIAWAPRYSSLIKFVIKEQAGLDVVDPSPSAVYTKVMAMIADYSIAGKLRESSERLSKTLFSPDHLQDTFVGEITKLAAGYTARNGR